MATIILFVLAGIALWKWNKGDRATYYLILQFLIFKCYSLQFFENTSIRADDVALIMVIYTVIAGYSKEFKIPSRIKRHVWIFSWFVAGVSLVSLLVYDSPLPSVVRGGRTFLFILAVFDIMKMKEKEIETFFYRISILTLIFGALYVLQMFLPLGLLTDVESASVGFLGLHRYYSFPPFVALCCLFTIFIMAKAQRFKMLFIITSLALLLLVQSRGMLINVIVLLLLTTLFLNRRNSRKILYVILLMVLAYILNDVVFTGETGSKTVNDFSMTFSGEYMNEESVAESDATFAYRMYLLFQSIVAYTHANITQVVFGFGFLGNNITSADVARLGLQDVARYVMRGEQWTYVINTPDISYPNILNYLGVVGTVIYLAFFVNLIRAFNKMRRNSNYAVYGLCFTVYLLLIGLDSSSITYPTCLIVPFIFYRKAKLEQVRLSAEQGMMKQ